MRSRVALAFVVAVSLVVAPPLLAQPNLETLPGRWDAIVTANGVEVPFVFEVTRDGDAVRASLFNGERRLTSTAARIEGETVVLPFEQYASSLRLQARGNELAGEYRRARGEPFPVRARREQPETTPVTDAPDISGTWITAANSNKGEQAWRFIASQRGANVEATILRVDGDTGTLTGRFQDGRFVLSHFSGARPLLLEITPKPDGTLVLKQNGKTELAAARESAPAAASLGMPTDPAQHTRVQNPDEPFRFSFPDLNGALVSNTDRRFAGKVVLVNISGSWCPNCHDEAPFLSSLYKRYQDKGLEIVALSFEEADQLANPTRLRAFIEEYGIDYTVLIPGEPDQLEAKVPQAVNLNAFPTTFILGRDGKVRGVHAGFPSPGSGEFYRKAEREMTEEVERLLAERAGTR